MAIKFSILGLLHYRDMHGYQIKKHIETHFGHMWSINFGQIYPNLKAMLEQGLVTMRLDPNHGEKGPGRKLYSITPKGKQVFQEWLTSEPEKNMILRDPFLMRFVFFGFGDEERALELIDRQIELYEKQLQTRQDNLKRWKKKNTYVRLTGELGVGMNEMFLNWLKKAREEISAELKQDGTIRVQAGGI